MRKVYDENGFIAGNHQSIELSGDKIQIGLEQTGWIEVMGGRWALQSKKSVVS